MKKITSILCVLLIFATLLSGCALKEEAGDNKASAEEAKNEYSKMTEKEKHNAFLKSFVGYVTDASEEEHPEIYKAFDPIYEYFETEIHGELEKGVVFSIKEDIYDVEVSLPAIGLSVSSVSAANEIFASPTAESFWDLGLRVTCTHVVELFGKKYQLLNTWHLSADDFGETREYLKPSYRAYKGALFFYQYDGGVVLPFPDACRQGILSEEEFNEILVGLTTLGNRHLILFPDDATYEAWKKVGPFDEY